MFTHGKRRGKALLTTRDVWGAIVTGAVMTFAVCVPAGASADNTAVTVFDVRKSLPLNENEPVYHDYYINAGPEAGLKKGIYAMVVRRTPIHDPVQNKAQATLSVDVARVKIIHVERRMSVARIVSDTPTAERPILDYEGVMIGDELDLTTVTTEPPKDSKPLGGRAQNAFLEEPQPDMVRSADDKHRIETRPKLEALSHGST